MPNPRNEDDRKRRDPYDPRTGSTGNDDPNDVDDDAELDGDEETEGEGKEPG